MHANPEMVRIARRILVIERATNQLGTSQAAAFDVCEKLRGSLSALAGVAGFRSLISRALALAKAEVDWLLPITLEPNGSLQGLEAAAGLPADEISRGETILIAQLVNLLITFIGVALTMRLLQEAWPEISHNDLSSGPETEENHDE